MTSRPITRMMSVLNATRWMTFGGAVVFGGAFLATAMDRAPVLAFASIEAELGQDVYHPGDTVSGYWRVKALRACDAVADRWVTIAGRDGDVWVYRLPSVPVRLTDYKERVPGEIVYPITAFSLPPETPTGTATYHHVDSYQCSPPGQLLFPIVQPYPVVAFRVEPPER